MPRELFETDDPRDLFAGLDTPSVDGRTASELTPGHLSALGSQRHRVAFCLADGAWWTLAELCLRCGGSQAGVSARLRDLRKPEYGSWTVERDYLATARVFRYRVPMVECTLLLQHARATGPVAI